MDKYTNAHRLSGVAPSVEHNFDGDIKELRQSENKPIQVLGEITIKVGERSAKLNTYTVSVTDSTFNDLEFDRQIRARQKPSDTGVNADDELVRSSTIYENGQHETPDRASAEATSRTRENDLVAREYRPPKRPKTTVPSSTPQATPIHPPESQSQGISAKAIGSERIDQLFTFMENWHSEWVRQGGWLFDNVTKANNSSESNRAELEKKLEAVQEILGQALNAAGQGLMTELVSVSKGIPWLEYSRKLSNDQVQAREEKWRTSSATFHDQTRRDREAAEKKIEQRLEAQSELLMKLARANGVDIDSPEVSREASLGAQLTRELNNEVAKSHAALKRKAHLEPIDVDEDD